MKNVSRCPYVQEHSHRERCDLESGKFCRFFSNTFLSNLTLFMKIMVWWCSLINRYWLNLFFLGGWITFWWITVIKSYSKCIGTHMNIIHNRWFCINKVTIFESRWVKPEWCKTEDDEGFSPTWILFQEIKCKITCTFKNLYYTAFFDGSEFIFNKFSS